VAYNLTGKTEYLELAKAGVDYLRANALDPNGGAYTYFDEEGQGQPDQQKRTFFKIHQRTICQSQLEIFD
jgi:uncharacterized protein YyaL (SSP411 family)